MKAIELLKNTDFELLKGDLDIEITGICHDNRKIKPGDAFVCIKGVHFDTHEIASEIASSGAPLLVIDHDIDLDSVDSSVVRVNNTRSASAYMAQAFYGNPQEKLKIVAITGSKGKTTATHMLAAILREAGLNTGTIGTNGAIFPMDENALMVPGAERFTYIEAPETPGYFYFETHNTTPEPMELYLYMAMMVKAGCTHLVMEVSSQAAKQNRTDGLSYEYGIWTNLATGDHIGSTEHPTFEDYMECKAHVLNHSKTIFLNRDDEYYDEFLPYIELPKADGSDGRSMFTYGVTDKSDYIGKHLEKHYDENSRQPFIDFSIGGRMHIDVSINLPGDFNMYNAIPCIAVANLMGIRNEDIKSALTHLKIRARYEMVFDNGSIRVCVDYAHNGYSTMHHLQGLREYNPKRLICVYSADGSRDIARRPEQGSIAAKLADISVITEGHSRYEPFEDIAKGILEGVTEAEKELGHPVEYKVVPKRKDAIKYAMSIAEDGDIVTIVGVGLHKSYLDIMGVEVPHSDAECVHEFAKEFGWE